MIHLLIALCTKVSRKIDDRLRKNLKEGQRRLDEKTWYGSRFVFGESVGILLQNIGRRRVGDSKVKS